MGCNPVHVVDVRALCYRCRRGFSTDMHRQVGPTYTLCFWGISQWLDKLNWQATDRSQINELRLELHKTRDTKQSMGYTSKRLECLCATQLKLPLLGRLHMDQQGAYQQWSPSDTVCSLMSWLAFEPCAEVCWLTTGACSGPSSNSSGGDYGPLETVPVPGCHLHPQQIA